MTIIEKCNESACPNVQVNYQGNFQAGNVSPRSNFIDYFDYLYSYPPKFKIKWGAIDEFKGDRFFKYNYGVLEQSFPFIDFTEDWRSSEAVQEAKPEKYEISQYIDGFLDKLNSSKFYASKTGSIQKALANIPVYVILNGQGEIVLNKSSTAVKTSGLRGMVSQVGYDFCGAFDQNVEKSQQLGLIFMAFEDAENYLHEVARTDIDGTQRLGLSIHCIGLDAAYKITREFHPGVDFRFVPSFSEVKGLLNKEISDSNFVVDIEQQQLRFRRRAVNIFPYLGKLGSQISPASSFLQHKEYFKGVPIYIVQVSNTPATLTNESLKKVLGVIDGFYGRCLHSLDTVFGFGHNWLMQGSVKDAATSLDTTNVIFFERDKALSFLKEQGRNINRYPGSRASNLSRVIRKPKILVYNFEDFVESWEDEIQMKKEPKQSIFATKDTFFIKSFEDVPTYEVSSIDKAKLAFRLKYQNLKRFTNVFFSVN